MHYSIFATLAISGYASAAAAAAQTTQCAQGLHMIMARGTGEAEGPGIMRLLGERIAERIEGSDWVGLDYPASDKNPPYATSMTEGGNEIREVVEAYAEDCPDTPIVLFGYSQVCCLHRSDYPLSMRETVHG